MICFHVCRKGASDMLRTGTIHSAKVAEIIYLCKVSGGLLLKNGVKGVSAVAGITVPAASGARNRRARTCFRLYITKKEGLRFHSPSGIFSVCYDYSSAS